MAELFFTAAWAAGFIEGSSVLNHANKRQDDARRRSTPLLFIPSMLYSTAALPLTVIGASPGPSLVAWFPFAPPLLESGGNNVPSTLSRPESSTTKNKYTTNAEAIPNTLIDESETVIEDEHHPIMSRHDLVRKMREDNKRALLAMQQKHTQPTVSEQRQQPRVVPQKKASRKLISTLDGRSLGTPLAEAMRRARFLCIGAGLVLTVASYEQERQRELEPERALQLEQQRNGRDINAIQSFVKENGSKNGSAVRLLSSNDSICDVTKSKGVIPLVYGHSFPSSSSLKVSNEQDSNNGSEHSSFWNLVTIPQEWRQLPLTKDYWLLQRTTGVYGHSVPPSSNVKARNEDDATSSSKDSPFWNLGTTPQEWRKTPMTKDWLLQVSGVGRLVLEADLSCDSLSEYLSQEDTPTNKSFENIRWVSKILGMIAQQNGVVSTSGENVGDEKAITVLIGCGKRPLELSEIDSVVYIDGSASVAAKVYSVLEEMNAKPCPKDKLEYESEATGDDDQHGPALISALDYVGMKLRQGGTRVLTTIGGVFFRRREEKNVYVVSDHSFAPIWLRQVMPHKWTVIAFDALENVETFQELEDGGVTFVCCQTDEATSAVVCSLLLTGGEDANQNRLVALVQDESCASSLRDLARDFKKETNIEIVSVKGVHADLFAQTRELLSSGKAPKEVQELIHES